MAGAASAIEIDEFINGALMSWLESCLPHPEMLTGYASLLDGTVIHSVWLQIDPEPQNHPSKIETFSGVSLCNARTRNFECIIRNLKSLFEEEFEQIILLLPDAYTLGYHPETKHGLEQMKTLLTLLLGAAVQCPNKESFIGHIKSMDVAMQHAIVELIKQVTDNQSLVVTKESVRHLPSPKIFSHILRLTKQRDDLYTKWISTICAEHDANATAAATIAKGNVSASPDTTACAWRAPAPTTSLESNHMAVELADLKSKLRKLRQELEEKSENHLELKEELEQKGAQYDQLRAESQEWYAQAKRVAAYRDEVDVLRERAERAERLEVEVQRFREKLTDAEFYKTRVEELREDNRTLLETKEMLEDQLQHCRKRLDHAIALESEIIKYKQKLNDMVLERDADRTKMKELLEENTHLQLVSHNLNSTQQMDKSFSDLEDLSNVGDHNLSEQLTNSAQTRALKLELENKRLTAALDQLKETSLHESTTKLLELEKEKKKLTLKNEQLHENIQRLTLQNVELENVFKNALDENKKLQDALDKRRKSHDRQSLEREIDRQKMIDLEKQVEMLSKEKYRVQTLNESIKRRADDMERMQEAKTQEIEQLNSKLYNFDSTMERLYDAENKVNVLERENGSLTKEVSKLRENIERKDVALDEATLQLDAQTKESHKLMKLVHDAEQTQVRFAELEKQNQELTSQHDIDMETIATLQKDLVTGTIATNKVKQSLEKLGLVVDTSGGGGIGGGGIGSSSSGIGSGSGNIGGDDSVELSVEHVVKNLVRNPETFKTVREIMLNACKENNNGVNARSDICVLCHRKEIYTVEKNIELSNDNVVLNAMLIESNEANETSNNGAINMNDEFGTTSGATATAKHHYSDNEQLQTENARLTVDVATLGSQITSLNTQQVALQLANSQLAADKDQLLKLLEALKHEHKNLLHDQITLQSLHDQLSVEYESLNKGKDQMKAIVRDLRNESRELRERIARLEKQIEDLNKQNVVMKSCAEDLTILRTEHSKLTDDFRNLFATNDRFKNEYKNIQEQYKMIRMENGKLKVAHTNLSGDLNARCDQVKLLEIEYTKIVQKCEMLVKTNADLDTDRKALMVNVSQLLSQYHELLSHSLDDKRHFHEEEKSYAERVHNLSRQKEKLEEKIMEHYKKSEGTPHKKKPFASNLVRRMKKASSDLMNKVPSRNRRSWVADPRLTQSQFMIGSESGGNDSDNSTEEPLSIASDTHLLQRNIPMRQSLQRMEAPDVTGSSLTLGTAGSRRTVYLIDENDKITEGDRQSVESPTNSINSPSTLGDNTTDPSTLTSTPIPTPTQSTSDCPSTFLMYNRINTMIGGSAQPNAAAMLATTEPISNGGSVSSNNRDMTVGNTQGDDSILRIQRTDDKRNSVWYEYGCV